VLERVAELAGLLRKNGLRVSTAELMDASRAAAAVGLARPDTLREALAAALVKRAPDRPVFDEIFDLTFLRGPGARLASLAALLARAGLDEGRARALVEEARRDLAAMSPLARAALGMGGGLAPIVAEAGQRASVGRMVSPLQVGYFTQRVLDALGLAAAEQDLDALLARLADLGLSPGEVELLGELIAQQVADLRLAVREQVAAEARRQNLAAQSAAQTRALASRPLAALTEKEIVELRGEVARLARLLRARIVLEPHAPRRGRLDLRRTLRSSLATGGVPFIIQRRERRPRRPRLVVLCDISDSVRNVSRFLLELVYALEAEFDRVSSFAFVADIGELSPLFRANKADRAIELAYAGAVVNVFANSNYGRVFAAFAARHLGRLTSRTTILIIGDGRNNYHPTRVDALAAMRRRARQIVWLNPEPPPVWGFGDSAMKDYAPYCDRIAVARDLDSLREVVDQLVGKRRHRRGLA
jgi:uncharacterized protein with von Willebrand factor type A (vWA) domain